MDTPFGYVNATVAIPLKSRRQISQELRRVVASQTLVISSTATIESAKQLKPIEPGAICLPVVTI